MSNKITGKVLAVQLGREESHLVLLSGAGDVQHAVTLPTPLGAVDDGAIRNIEEVKGMMKEALMDPAFDKVRKVVFTLCTSQVIAETVRTPDLPEAKLGKLLHANADMYFPVDIKDYQLVWQVIGSSQNDDGQKELAVQLWAVPAGMLNAYYKVANGCGLSVAAIDYCGHSMAGLAGASFAKAQKGAKDRKKLDLNMELSFGAKKKAEPVQEAPSMEEQGPAETQLYLSLDKDLLGMTFVQNNQVVMQRIIRCGSQLVYQFGELAMMLEYFQSMEQGRGSMIRGFVTGSYAKDADTVAELADMLGINLIAPALPYDLSYCLCVGASRTELDFGNPALNVVDKARREVKSQLWQYGLVLGGGLVLVLVLMLTMTSRLGWDSNIRKLQSQQQTLAIQASKVAGFADNFYDYTNKYNAYSADWDAVFGNMQTYNDNLVLVMDELENMLPENSSVLGMQIAANGLNVTFACENKEEAAYLIMALRDMKYADLMVISDMGGGGAGPATSYGSGSEAAPKEGSADLINGVPADQWEILKASISADMDPYVVAYNLGMGYRTKALLTELEEVYGLKVVNTYETLEELREDMGDLLTYEKRANAFWQMCTTNPFAMDSAQDLLMLDYISGGTLYQYVLDGLEEAGYGPNEVYKHKSVEELQEHIEVLAGIIVNYDGKYDAMTQVEKVLKNDPEMEAWYIYYLEAELTKVEVEDEVVLEEEKPLPYLDLDKMTLEIVNEHAFISEYKELNEALTALMSERTIALMNSMVKPEIPEETTPSEPSEEPSEPSEETTTPSEPQEPLTDKYIQIMKTGLSGYLKDDFLPAYGDVTYEVESMLDKYFEYGSTGAGAEYDAFLGEYISEKNVDAELAALILEYKEDPGAMKNQSIRKMLDNYTKGCAGNGILDAWVARCSVDLDQPDHPEHPTDPSEPSEEPTEPSEEPTEPSEEPTEPSEEPTEPSEEPTEPSEEPTEPSEEPTDPSEPEEELDPIYATALKNYLPNYLLKDELPDHAMAVVIEMALDNFFETGESGQDAKYDKFLNDYIASKAVDAELYELLAEYETDPESLKNQSIRIMLDCYFVDEAKTTGNEVLDEWIKRCDEATEAPEKIPADLETKLKESLSDYLVKDTLSSAGDTASKIEPMLDKFFEEGKSGEGDLYDNFLNDYIDTKVVDKELTSLVYMYHQKPDSLKNQSVRKMLDNFFNLELMSTGSEALDAWVTRAMDAQEEYVKSIPEKLPVWLEEFLNPKFYNTGDAYGNFIIEKYLTTGKADTDEYTEILDKSVSTNKAAYQRLLVWLNAYLYNKPALNNYPVMLTMLDNYYKNKTTGSEALDAQIKQAAKDLANAANKPSGGSGSGGGQSQPQDTRVYFAVILNYNSELANAELARKGLDYNKKIPMLEVGK